MHSNQKSFSFTEKIPCKMYGGEKKNEAHEEETQPSKPIISSAFFCGFYLHTDTHTQAKKTHIHDHKKKRES